ncbi:MAG: exlusion protein FxsA [Alphaproteobacteria bacterium]|nr:exlusion protein FxsA [Alphaproteobacteria bacterium]
MALFLVAVFLIGPIAEIFVLLKAGAAFGALPVVAACVATAVIGGIVLRLQGIEALAAAQRDLNAGRAPIGAISDGAFLILAAPMLMTPGFITDAIGFALLTPPIRRRLAQSAVAYFKARADIEGRIITVTRVDP